jgi:hypothetical protein
MWVISRYRLEQAQLRYKLERCKTEPPPAVLAATLELAPGVQLALPYMEEHQAQKVSWKP